jgi:hypothetical protein
MSTTKEALEAFTEDELYALVLHAVRKRNKHGRGYVVEFRWRMLKDIHEPVPWNNGYAEHFMRHACAASELISIALAVLAEKNAVEPRDKGIFDG